MGNSNHKIGKWCADEDTIYFKCETYNGLVNLNMRYVGTQFDEFEINNPNEFEGTLLDLYHFNEIAKEEKNYKQLMLDWFKRRTLRKK